MDRPIYLDYNATTPVDPDVLESMLPYLRESFGNASSTTHSYGWEASAGVEKSRKSVAKLINADVKSIIWTSGATESNNLALFGVLRGFVKRKEKAHLITTLVEHKCVLDTAAALEDEGVEVTYLKPDSDGRVNEKDVEAAILPHTQMISVIMGQNEIGSINPIANISKVARDHQIFFHVDAAQALGKEPIDVEAMNIDLMSASGHKMYAPKGVGFLYVRTENPSVELNPLIFGGSQERGIRPGTLNVPGIVAMGRACEICLDQMANEKSRLTKLRDDFIAKILTQLPSVKLNGHPTERLSTNVSLSFQGLSSDIFALGLSGLAVSSGSACSAGAPSHVLKAIGLPTELSHATVRFGLGRFTTESDLNIAAEKIIEMVKNNQLLTEG